MEQENITQPLINGEDEDQQEKIQNKQNMVNLAKSIIAEEDDETIEDNETCCDKTFWCILRFFNILKMIVMIGLVVYFWVWTADNRETDMDVIEQLSKYGILDMTFHENRLFGNVNNGSDTTAKQDISKIKVEQIRQSKTVIFHDFAEGSVGHMPDYKFKSSCLETNQNQTLQFKCLELKDDIWDAFKDQVYNQLGDKTFLLIIIFTISWSNWHLDLERPVKKVDENEEAHKETTEVKFEHHEQEVNNDEDDDDAFGPSLNEGGTQEEIELAKLIIKTKQPTKMKNIHIHPIRIYVSATIGLMIANIFSIQLQNNVYANETRLSVSILIVVFLLHYMYSICRSHLEWETEAEEIEQEHQDNINKMKKHDILEKFQDGEMEKKQRKQNQRRLTMKFGIYQDQSTEKALQRNVTQFMEDVDNNGDENDNMLVKKILENKHKDEVNTQAKQLWKSIPTEIANKAELEEELLIKQESHIGADDDSNKSEVDSENILLMTKSRLENEVKQGRISAAKMKFLKFLVDFRTELIFLIFITSQEIQDTSYQRQIIMRTQYTDFANTMGCVFAIIIVNLGIVCVAYLYTGLCMTTQDSNTMGIASFYFITGYEFLFHILRWGAAYLDLLHYKGEKVA